MAQQAASLVILFFFAVPAKALAGADDWSDFTNNFATDLAPIIVLFGEQASKQFLSESTSVWDNIIFGIAPIGIITAVVSTIRLYGSSPLKAFIGRAQEAHGAAEAELCSSTSEDVCELWSNGGICRVFGRPRILEFFHVKRADDGNAVSGASAFYPSFKRQVNTKRPPSCGLYAPESVLLDDDELPHDADDGTGTSCRPKTGWKEVGKKPRSLGPSSSSLSSANLLNAQERGRARVFAPYPNLSLNIGIRTVPLGVLRTIAALGVLLQLSFFGFATWATFYYPELYDGEGLPSTWSFCLAVSGTAILTAGMICCAMLIENMSRERRFTDESQTPSSKDTTDGTSPSSTGADTTTFWLQPGNQRVGDQLFNAFAYSKSKNKFITSWKVDIEGFDSAAVGGHRIFVTLCMAVGRSLLRSGRLGADENKLKQRRDVEGHELDWQAMNLEKPGEEFEGGWYIDDLVSPLQNPKDGGEQEKHDGWAPDSGIDVAPETQQMASFRIRLDRDIDPVESAKTAVSWARHNEADGDGRPNEAARTLHYRASLAYLTGDAIRAPEQRWETLVRATARQLQRAMQEAAEYIFSDMALLKGWGESRSLVWSTTCRLHEARTPSNASTGTATDAQGPTAVAVPSQPIHFAMHQVGGLWEISECQLEAALGLWYWSVSQLQPSRTGRSSSQRKIFMAEREMTKEALVSGIRLWVTQTHHISTVAPFLSEEERYADPGPAGEDDGGLDGICLSISTKSSLLQLVAQDLFGIFFSRIADVLEPLDTAEPLTRRPQTQQAFGGADLGADAAVHSFIGLTNKHVQALADVFVASGIGSREDSLMTLIPPLLQRGKLPETLPVMESLLRTAKTLRRSNRLTQAEGLLRWLIDNVPLELQPRAVMGLGNLYRHALRSNDPFDRNFGRNGFEATLQILLHDRQPPMTPECKRLIHAYTQAWVMMKHIRPGFKKKQLGPVLETLDASSPEARAWGLYVVDECDVDAAAVEDVLGLLRWAIKARCPELIEDLWSRPRIGNLFDARSVHVRSAARSPLLWAVELEGDAETIETLLDWPGLDTSPLAYGKTPLAAASAAGHYTAVDLLLKSGVSPDELDGLPLLLAVENKHLGVVRRLLQAGASTNLKAKSHGVHYRRTPLHAAIGWNSTVAELLLEHRADPDALDSDDETPLCVAVEMGDAASVEVLLKHGANVIRPGAFNRAVGMDKISLIRKAIQRGDDATVKMLITVRRVHLGGLKEPLMHDAVRSRKKTIVDLLLEHGAGSETRDDQGKTPLLVAVEEGLVEIAARLLEAKADPNAQSADNTSGPLHAAVESGNTQMVDLLLKAGAYAGAKDHAGRTPLLLALELEAAEHRSANEAVVASLLRAHADPNVSYPALADRDGISRSYIALHLAAKSGNSRMVELLVQNGAETEYLDNQRRTPLLAVLDDGGRPLRTGQHKEVVQRLLAAGADPHAMGGGECGTALQAAARLGHEDIVHELLRLGVDVHAQGGRYGSALQAAAAAWAGDEAVKMLLEAGADSTARGGQHGSALHAALAVLALPGGRSTGVLEMLLRRGADTEVRDQDELTPLLRAVGPGSGPVNLDAVRLLLKHKADMEARDGEGRAPLHMAAAVGNAGLVQVLLDHGADIESRDGKDRTPLLAASERGHKDVAEVLVRRGAKVDAEGGLYGTAMRGAMYRGDEPMTDMLRRVVVVEERG